MLWVPVFSREEGWENESRKEILFIDASKEFTPDKTQNVMADEHTGKVLNAYTNRLAIEKYSHLASPDEIAENDFNLNIPRYVDTFEPEEEIDITEIQKEITQIEKDLRQRQEHAA